MVAAAAANSGGGAAADAGPVAATAGADAAADAARLQRAFKESSLHFSFSAGGLLFPYYLGVVEQLTAQGVMTDSARLAGASAGSLIAACARSGLPLATIREACWALADDCRANGTRQRLGPVLEGVLRDVLPGDVHERCSGRVHVCVTRLGGGKWGPQLVTHFRSRDDLISALLTSCHIPFYFDGRMMTTFRRKPCFDGGFTNFLPDVPEADVTARVCCLPSKQLSAVSQVDIAPDVYDAAWPYSLQQMLAWAFEPAPQEQLDALVESGRRDAAAWASATGLAELAQQQRQQQQQQQDGGWKQLLQLPQFQQQRQQQEVPAKVPVVVLAGKGSSAAAVASQAGGLRLPWWGGGGADSGRDGGGGPGPAN